MDQALKQRLVGAVVLISLAMIVLPIIFEGNRKYEVDRASQLPPAPQYPAVAITDPQSPTTVPPPSPQALEQMFTAQDESTAPSSTVSGDTLASTTEVATVAIPAATGKAAVSSNPTAVTTKPAASAKLTTPAADRPTLAADGLPEGWVVQLGLFSDADKAKSMNRELLKRKQPVFLRQVTTAKSSGTKVFIGPFVDRKQADRVKTEMDKLYRINSIIVRFKP